MRNPDEDLRSLEREASLGDETARTRLVRERLRRGQDGIPFADAVKILDEARTWRDEGGKTLRTARRYGLAPARGVDRAFWTAEIVNDLMNLLTEPSRVALGQWASALFPTMDGGYVQSEHDRLAEGNFEGKLAQTAAISADGRTVEIVYFGIPWRAVSSRRQPSYTLYMGGKRIGWAIDPMLTGWQDEDWALPNGHPLSGHRRPSRTRRPDGTSLVPHASRYQGEHAAPLLQLVIRALGIAAWRSIYGDA